ncbi:MAG: phosphomannomutase, partial [Myxococcales bacterium]|nr:phosphomannomutase [Myxococcales bacterium]
DGDGDRLGVVTKGGDIIYPDRQLMLFARDVLSRNAGASIIFDVKCTQRLAPDIRAAGGVPLMWMTGHSLIKAKLRETGAPLAGEMSGHIYFSDNYFGVDDGVFAGCRVLEILSRSTKPLSALLADVPTYPNTPELRVECTEAEKFKIVAEVAAYFRGKYETIDVDGVRVVFPDGWALARASNTQPVIVVRFEARTPERLEEFKTLFRDQLKKYPSVKLDF